MLCEKKSGGKGAGIGTREVKGKGNGRMRGKGGKGSERQRNVSRRKKGTGTGRVTHFFNKRLIGVPGRALRYLACPSPTLKKVSRARRPNRDRD